MTNMTENCLLISFSMSWRGINFDLHTLDFRLPFFTVAWLGKIESAISFCFFDFWLRNYVLYVPPKNWLSPPKRKCSNFSHFFQTTFSRIKESTRIINFPVWNFLKMIVLIFLLKHTRTELSSALIKLQFHKY